jgi:hypothetical protein
MVTNNIFPAEKNKRSLTGARVLPENTCGYCHRVITGRRNKKYCDNNCKNAHFNELNALTNEHLRPYLKPLIANWRLLKNFHEKYGNDPIPYLDIIEKGLNPKITYQYIKTPEYGFEVHMIFDFGYRYDKESQTIKIFTEDELRSL